VIPGPAAAHRLLRDSKLQARGPRFLEGLDVIDIDVLDGLVAEDLLVDPLGLEPPLLVLGATVRPHLLDVLGVHGPPARGLELRTNLGLLGRRPLAHLLNDFQDRRR
jgi:hypothetical protein